MDMEAGSTTDRLCNLGQVAGPLQASDPTFVLLHRLAAWQGAVSLGCGGQV